MGQLRRQSLSQTDAIGMYNATKGLGAEFGWAAKACLGSLWRAKTASMDVGFNLRHFPAHRTQWLFRSNERAIVSQILTILRGTCSAPDWRRQAMVPTVLGACLRAQKSVLVIRQQSRFECRVVHRCFGQPAYSLAIPK